MTHMEKTPISRLSAVGEREVLYASTGLLLTRPQSESEDMTPTRYVSHDMSYGDLVRALVLDTMSANGDAIPVDRPIPSSYTTIGSVSPSGMYAMSAMSNDDAAQMDGVSVYNIHTAVAGILGDVRVPHVAAKTSPWLLSADVVSSPGDLSVKVASQSLAMALSSQTSSEMYGNVLATHTGPSQTTAASQMLATAVSDVTETSCRELFDVEGLLSTSMVSSGPSYSDEAAASIGFVTKVHDMLSSIPTEPPKPHEDGNVWYLTPDMVGKSKPIMKQQVLVVDDETDIVATQTDGIDMNTVFSDWTVGGQTGDDLHYESDQRSYPKMAMCGIDHLMSCFGVTGGEFRNCDQARLQQIMRTTKPYGEVLDYYVGGGVNPGYSLNVEFPTLKVQHVLTARNTSTGYVGYGIFSTEDVSAVLSDVAKYRTVGGTCLHNISAAGGALTSLLEKTVQQVHWSQESCVISADWEWVIQNHVEAPSDYNVPIHSNDYGYGYWFYNGRLSSIVQIKNTIDNSYFISDREYDRYDVTFRVRSQNNDDDFNGFIAAYGDNDGTPITLGVQRNCNSTNDMFPFQHWTFVIGSVSNSRMTNVVKSGHVGCRPQDMSYGAPYVVARLSAEDSNVGKYARSYLTGGLGSGETEQFAGHEWTYEECSASGWGKYPDGVLVRVRRDGDSISAWTTEFGHDAVLSNLGHMMVVDLAETGTNFFGCNLGKYLPCFRGASRIGFMSQSQPQSTFELVDVKIPKTVAGSQTNQICSVYGDEVQWLDGTGTDAAGLGRFVRNPYTRKVYFSDANGFVKIYQPKNTPPTAIA